MDGPKAVIGSACPLQDVRSRVPRQQQPTKQRCTHARPQLHCTSQSLYLMRGVALCSLWAEEGLDLSICVEDESQRQRTMAHALSSFFFFCANASGETCIRCLCHLQVCLLCLSILNSASPAHTSLRTHVSKRPWTEHCSGRAHCLQHTCKNTNPN